jgi:hypothetical protein
MAQTPPQRRRRPLLGVLVALGFWLVTVALVILFRWL